MKPNLRQRITKLNKLLTYTDDPSVQIGVALVQADLLNHSLLALGRDATAVVVVEAVPGRVRLMHQLR